MTATCLAVPVSSHGVAIDVAEDVSPLEWDTYVESHPQASRYHLWAWRQIFENAFGLETVYLAARTANAVTGVLPLVLFRSVLFGRFAVSLPFVDQGGICADDGASAEALRDRAVALARERGLSYLELRHVCRRFSDLPAREHKVGMTLPLRASATEMWEALDRKVRNQVRKAEKSNLQGREGGAELVPQFYEVFAHNMRDLGTPVYARRFFEQVLAEPATQARVHLIEHTGRPVAAAIALTRGDQVAVPWASSLRAYRQMCPNNLLYWRMIERAIEDGFSVFDFGRSTPGQGTFHFKRQWGAEPTALHWEYCLAPGVPVPNLSPSNPRFDVAIAIWKRLPLPLTRALGPRIVRSLP